MLSPEPTLRNSLSICWIGVRAPLSYPILFGKHIDKKVAGQQAVSDEGSSSQKFATFLSLRLSSQFPGPTRLGGAGLHGIGQFVL